MTILANFLYWLLLPILGLIIEGGILFFLCYKKIPPSLLFLKKLYYFYFIFLIIYAFSLSGLNYYLWSKGELTQKLLPPYTPLSYFFRYSFQYFYFEILLRLIFSLITFLGIHFLNKKFQQKFFYEEEKYLAALSILILNWPMSFFYLILVPVLGLISHFLYFLIFKKLRRVSFLYFWSITALLVLLFNGIIIKIPFFQSLKV
ncbi:MAG: hypothetical protein ACPLXL_00805 [Minisyncoccia bacterium]